MNHLHSLDDLHISGCWGTVGVFDGVHLGHQAIIHRLVEGAHQAGLLSLVVTFYPHPVIILKQLKTAKYLTLPDERAELFGSLGVDYVLTLPFDQRVADWTAREFMERLVSLSSLRHLLVGYDFSLGRRRTGTVPVLTQIGQELGYAVETAPEILKDGEVVSSSRVRSMIESGDVGGAARLLGRNYCVTGTVVAGQQRGRTIGFPTANLQISVERLLPAFGVYATRTLLNGAWLPSVTNIGIRPTFEKQDSLPWMECHLLEFSGDLYQQTLTIEYVERLRSEQQFPSLDALINQIGLDREKARLILAQQSN